ncbi:MAG: NAD(P)-dependent glycerol-3-phosphate dehydrogenase, partial [Dehalococcoidia bacterium]|nr:NAD(P)-dependent glycerol-3-phosphate dehydrogenase [Dehalococcoidia bacterium]
MTKATIVGTTSWGITLGGVLAGKGYHVDIWARTEAEANDSTRKHNGHCKLRYVCSPSEAVEDSNLVIWAVPAQSLRQNVRHFRNLIDPSTILVNAAKGIEAHTGKRMTEVMAEELDPSSWSKICVLSGPNLAREVAQGLPATAVVAARETKTALAAQEILNTPDFRVFTSSDVIGVELCGALKNIIALGAGIVDGMELGDNAKGAFIALGWAEMVSVGRACGADEATFYGVAGIGDLFATCSSPLSRNHTVGCELARGRPLADIMADTHNVAEGIDTTVGLMNLARTLKLELPIT